MGEGHTFNPDGHNEQITRNLSEQKTANNSYTDAKNLEGAAKVLNEEFDKHSNKKSETEKKPGFWEKFFPKK